VAVSVLEQFRDAEQRVAQRMKELEPMVAEYRELETIARRLGIDGPTTSDAEGSTPSARRRGRARRAPNKPARASRKAPSDAPRAHAQTPRRASGQREQQLLELVQGRPGITVREAGQSLGVDPTGLYRVVRRLEERGEMRKNGRSLQATGAPGAG
jgi:transcriptional regulator with GAF, ATPase, and Fis domain